MNLLQSIQQIKCPREYKAKTKLSLQSSVGDSNSVQYIKDKEDELAYVNASYFIKTGNEFSRTYEKFVLRKNDEGQWKILHFYQVEGDSSEDEE